MKEVLDHLSENYWPLNVSARSYIVDNSPEITVKKKELLLKQGDICRHVWFVKKGILRSYEHNEKGRGFSNWFMLENDVATSVISFFEGEPTEEVIEAYEGSVLYKMSKEDLFAGIARYKSIALLTLMIVIKYYCQSRRLESILRRKDQRQIHQYLLHHHSELVQRVSEKDLTSFLGITQPTYNNIKKGKKAGADSKGKKKKGQ
jgi:CRP-like cAMP-binding protein